MDQEAINRDLREKDANSSIMQKKILDKARALLKASSDHMSTYYNLWDSNDDIYRGYRVKDRNDQEAKEKGEPSKIIVPITFAQVQTAISFILSSFQQRARFFELRGMGPEDEHKCFALEADLDYQLNRNKSYLLFYNWMLDSFKCGFGVTKCDWAVDKMKVRAKKTVPVGGPMAMFAQMFGQPVQSKTIETVEEVVAYEGNRLRNVTPWAFLPDPSVPLARFQEGQFCGDEEEVSLDYLKRQEGNQYFGTDKIPDRWSHEIYSSRKRRAGVNRKPVTAEVGKADVRQVVRSELQMSLVPKKWSEESGIDFGAEDYPVKFLVVIANDQKVIRFERCNFLHDCFTYNLMEYTPDHNSFFNQGLCDTVYELQNLITFFLNSHVINVRKIIQNRFIGDPSKIEMDDVKNNASFIRTKGTQVNSLDRIIKQLDVVDVTQRHVDDMGVLSELVQLVTGVNENALGQYSGGRRSATEARNVNAGAAARLKTHATLFWIQGIEPLGRMMVSNTRQGRSKEIYEQIVGSLAQKAPFEDVILADTSKLAGGFDFVQYDATLPSDRQQQANMLRDLFGILVQNPETIQLLNKNPVKLLDHIAELYNIKNLGDFDALPPGGLSQPPVAQITPDEIAKQVAQSGQGSPVDVSGVNLLQSLQPQQ